MQNIYSEIFHDFGRASSLTVEPGAASNFRLGLAQPHGTPVESKMFIVLRVATFISCPQLHNLTIVYRFANRCDQAVTSGCSEAQQLRRTEYEPTLGHDHIAHDKTPRQPREPPPPHATVKVD
jgi:hypothetical protein